MNDRDQPQAAPVRLGKWSLYFLAKFVLIWRDLIDFHPIENLAFAAFLLTPIKGSRARAARNVIAVPIATALLYYDSRLPALERILSQSSLVSNFSASYLLELATRLINVEALALLVIACVVGIAASRYFRLGLPVVVALVVLAVQGEGSRSSSVSASQQSAAVPSRSQEDPDAILRSFYAAEAQRKVSLPSPSAAATPFDIVILHICSLSWDDLEASGLDSHPFWKRMDIVFKRFNTASSYSGPAAIRINRAMCGQSPHSALYDGAASQCYLMPSLRNAGFATNLAMNHDGHFDDFLKTLRNQGIDSPLQSLAGTPVPQRAFDDSPIYDDNAVLSRWLDSRGENKSPRVALYYNSISLHDGNRIVSGANSRLGSMDSYRPRLEKLLDDLEIFMQQLERSGRRAVVFVVPEHGAAIRGDKLQFAGLRDIATPKITTVPAGVVVIGPGAKRIGEQAVVSQSVSYLAISTLMSEMIAQPPYSEAGFEAVRYTANVAATRHVTENDAASIVEGDRGYWMRQGKDAWEQYQIQ